MSKRKLDPCFEILYTSLGVMFLTKGMKFDLQLKLISIRKSGMLSRALKIALQVIVKALHFCEGQDSAVSTFG